MDGAGWLLEADGWGGGARLYREEGPLGEMEGPFAFPDRPVGPV